MDLTSKSCYVYGINLMDTPSSVNYEIVFIRYSTHIKLLVYYLNKLDILDGDTRNAYLNDPTKEKLYLYSGNEWNQTVTK